MQIVLAIPKAGVEEWLINIENYYKIRTENLEGEIAAAKIIGSQAIHSPEVDTETPLPVTGLGRRIYQQKNGTRNKN